MLFNADGAMQNSALLIALALAALSVQTFNPFHAITNLFDELIMNTRKMLSISIQMQAILTMTPTRFLQT